MESRFRGILLALRFLVLVLPAAEAAAQSDEDGQTSLIEPQIERVDFDESLIDTADFEIALYGGYLAVENFDTNFVSGLRLGYHISEDFFVQASYGSSKVGKTSFEKLSGGAPLLSDSERDVEYYLISLGFNLFPGEAFLTDSTTFNTVFYISGGLGSTDFAGDERHTLTYAAGHRTVFTDNFSLDIEMRDLVFDMDIFGKEETTHNLEFTVAVNLFF
ncbi:MAG: outer membrane beta-barrel domain-containing protein [Gammaproteobacteria bacterium]|nr:outer membrane beta-barrel domain-containing protein [Gammaproteobacteria bacterium]